MTRNQLNRISSIIAQSIGFVFVFHFYMRYLYSQSDDRQRRARSDMQKIADIKRGKDSRAMNA